MYRFQVYFIDDDGSEVPIRILSPGLGLSYDGSFEVLPLALDEAKITASGLPQEVEAGIPVSLTLQAMDIYSNPTRLVDPESYQPFGQQPDNKTLLQVRLVTVDSGALQPNVVAIPTNTTGACSWSITFFTSMDYSVSVTYKESVLHMFSITVRNAQASPSNSTALLPEIGQAGTTLLYVTPRDLWGNIAPLANNDLSIGLTGSTFFHSFIPVEPVRKGDYSVYSLTLTEAGLYVVSIQLHNSSWLEKNITIEASYPSLQRSYVLGFGAGDPYGFAPTPLVAGEQYVLRVFIKDLYGNTIQADKVVDLNIVGPGQVLMNMSMLPSGAFEVIYQPIVVGVYAVIANLTTGLLLHRGAVYVQPGTFNPNATTLQVPDYIVAGEASSFKLAFHDSYGNAAASSGEASVVVFKYGGESLSFPLNLSGKFIEELPFRLMHSGLYAFSISVNSVLVKSNNGYLHVVPGSAYALNITELKMTDRLLEVYAYVVDEYLNSLNAAAMTAFAVAIDPPILFHGNVTLSSTGITLQLDKDPAIENTLQVQLKISNTIFFNCTWKPTAAHATLRRVRSIGPLIAITAVCVCILFASIALVWSFRMLRHKP
ncbi:hypothetical protein CHLRE_06g252750v5 [Chlamydomonas reinhardtii]|nr:uncharacterized protein CHLRE_06g252750v5 [Chlamydomonas reinhardtii]PNW81584.1 hypothetical protein CHLRE_06g252750v5 [Chlamydomonas reinhardtii]